MTTDRAAGLGLGLFALVDHAVIVTPAFVLAGAAEKGGIAGTHGLDLVVTSVLVGITSTAYLWTRLRRSRPRMALIDLLIAKVNGTVVLALASTLLLMGVLAGFSPQHATLVNRGWPVVALWAGVQLAAVLLAEHTRTRVLAWLRLAYDRPPRAPRRTQLHTSSRTRPESATAQRS